MKFYLFKSVSRIWKANWTRLKPNYKKSLPSKVFCCDDDDDFLFYLPIHMIATTKLIKRLRKLIVRFNISSKNCKIRKSSTRNFSKSIMAPSLSWMNWHVNSMSCKRLIWSSSIIFFLVCFSNNKKRKENNNRVIL